MAGGGAGGAGRANGGGGGLKMGGEGRRRWADNIRIAYLICVRLVFDYSAAIFNHTSHSARERLELQQ